MPAKGRHRRRLLVGRPTRPPGFLRQQRQLLLRPCPLPDRCPSVPVVALQRRRHNRQLLQTAPLATTPRRRRALGVRHLERQQQRRGWRRACHNRPPRTARGQKRQARQRQRGAVGDGVGGATRATKKWRQWQRLRRLRRLVVHQASKRKEATSGAMRTCLPRRLPRLAAPLAPPCRFPYHCPLRSHRRDPLSFPRTRRRLLLPPTVRCRPLRKRRPQRRPLRVQHQGCGTAFPGSAVAGCSA